VITVTTRANSTALTTVPAVKQMLGIEGTGEDAQIAVEIAAASAAIESYCHRVFARQAITELVKGYGGPYLMLGRAPVVRLGTILANSTDPITDARLENADAGLVYRKFNWDNTIQLGWTIGDTPLPGSEDPFYSIDYSAGYLLPGDDVEGEMTISVDGPTKQFRTTETFPRTLVSGDVLVAEGFAIAANNGRFTVATAAAQAITVVETTLATEAATEGLRFLRLCNLPADVELAAREAVRDVRLARRRDAAIASRTVGDLSISYRDPRALVGPAAPMTGGLPVDAALRLSPYVRAA